MNELEFRPLEAKIRQFAGELTPEEEAQLRAMQARWSDLGGLVSSPLWDKAQRVAGTLTPDEEATLRRMLGRTCVTAAGGDEADAEGFRAAFYEDEWGYKGRPGTGGATQIRPAGANGFGPVLGFLLIVGSVLPGVVLVEYPEYRPTGSDPGWR